MAHGFSYTLGSLLPVIRLSSLFIVLLTLLGGPSALSGFPLASFADQTIFLLAAAITACVFCLFAAFAALLSTLPLASYLGSGGIIAAGSLALDCAAASMGAGAGAFVGLGVLFGVGIAASTVHSGMVLLATPGEKALRLVPLACAIASSCRIGMAALCPPPVLVVVVVACLLLSSAGPLLLTSKPDVSRSAVELIRARIPGMLSRSWPVLCCYLLCVVVPALGWDLQPEAESNWALSVPTGFLTGALLCLLLMVWLRGSSIDAMLQFLPLICVTVLLLNWFFGLAAGKTDLPISSIPIGFAALVSAILLFLHARNEALQGIDTLFIFSLGTAFAVSGLLAIYAIAQVVSERMVGAFHLVTMVVFLMVMAISALAKLRQKAASGTLVVEDAILAHCQRFGTAVGLSKRETEVLFLMAQGYGAPQISKKLYISTNTVKGHTKSIYLKSGVHTKEQLIDMIFDKAEPRTHEARHLSI
jgi:DNA-binding CsgD family transcriptional regulator